MAVRPSMRDRVREEAQKSTKEGAGYLNIPKGVKLYQSETAEGVELDVIPYENNKKNHSKGYEVGELIPYFRFKIHKGIGADDQKYTCLTSFGKKCPICEEVQRMRKSPSGDAEIIKALAAKERFIMQVIDLKDKKNDSIQIWEESYHAFLKKLLADIDAAENSDNSRKRNRAHAGFAELEDGQTLIVDFLEKKGFKGFVEATRIDAENRDPYEESILDETHDLEDCLKVLSYEELEARFLELEPEEQGANRKREEKEEDTGRGSRRGKKEDSEEEQPPSRRRGKTEEKEDEPEPPPSRRRGKAAEEEPEEEKPAKRSGRRGAAKQEEAEEAPSRSSRRGKLEPEPDVEVEEPPAHSRRGAPKEEKEDNRCYVDGGVFGKDCDSHVAEAPEPNCYDCPEETWKACKEAQQAM